MSTSKSTPAGRRSASVILVKNCAKKGSYDYNIYLFKRNSKTQYGGMYAFPGGHVESQDIEENWLKLYPEFYHKFQNYNDLRFRIA